MGIIPPGAWMQVQFCMHVDAATKMCARKELSASVGGSITSDKFLVESAVIEEADLSTKEHVQNLATLWALPRWRKKTVRRKLVGKHYRMAVISDDSEEEAEAEEGEEAATVTSLAAPTTRQQGLDDRSTATTKDGAGAKHERRGQQPGAGLRGAADSEPAAVHGRDGSGSGRKERGRGRVERRRRRGHGLCLERESDMSALLGTGLSEEDHHHRRRGRQGTSRQRQRVRRQRRRGDREGEAGEDCDGASSAFSSSSSSSSGDGGIGLGIGLRNVDQLRSQRAIGAGTDGSDPGREKQQEQRTRRVGVSSTLGSHAGELGAETVFCSEKDVTFFLPPESWITHPHSADFVRRHVRLQL